MNGVVRPETMLLGKVARPARNRLGRLDAVDGRPERCDPAAGSAELPGPEPTHAPRPRNRRARLRIEEKGRDAAIGAEPGRRDLARAVFRDEELDEGGRLDVCDQRLSSSTMSLSGPAPSIG
jgi:hypothetical protein